MSEGGRTAEFCESFYAGAGDDYSQIPWARLSPRPVLVDWLDADPPAEDGPALSRPWPLTLSELRWFEDEGLQPTVHLGPDDDQFAHLEYRRPRRGRAEPRRWSGS